MAEDFPKPKPVLEETPEGSIINYLNVWDSLKAIINFNKEDLAKLEEIPPALFYEEYLTRYNYSCPELSDEQRIIVGKLNQLASQFNSERETLIKEGNIKKLEEYVQQANSLVKRV